MKEIDKIIYCFIWDNKPDRIRRTIIQNHKNQGGLGLTNIHLLNSCTKITWLTRIVKDTGSLGKLLLADLPRPCDVELLKYMLQGNMKSSDVHHFVKPYSKYWKEIWYYWTRYNYKSQNSIIEPNEITKQNIWFNTSIRIQGKPVYYYEWYTKGIKTIGDLRKGSKWVNATDLHITYNIKTNFLTLIAILQAIPLNWRRHYQDNAEIPVTRGTHEIENLLDTKRPLKYLQDKMQKSQGNLPTDKLDIWNIELDDDINQNIWLRNFMNIQKASISVKIRNFEYRYQVRDILSNVRLKKMKISDSEMCTFCNKSTETIRHLYWDCYYTKRLWERLKTWLSITHDTPDEYSPRYCLMGITDNNHYVPSFVYFMCILTKMFIHFCKNIHTRPTSTNLKKYITNVETIERNIATGKGRKSLLKHLNKWTSFIENDVAENIVGDTNT